jgi:3-oxoadipate enol-lactonase
MVELNVRRTGDGAPVVLLHPVGLDGSFWGSLPQKLASSRSVHAVDLMGHGDSPAASRPGQMVAHVESVSSVIEGIGQPALVVGVSFGGMVAQNLAIGRPDLVAGLMLVSCHAGLPEAGRDMMAQRARAVDDGQMDMVVEGMLQNMFSPELLETDLGRSVCARLLANEPSNFAATWEALSEHAAHARLPEVSCPAAVLIGDADKATSLAVARELADAIPHSKYIEMKGAPHMLHLEHEEEFGALVSEFAKERT